LASPPGAQKNAASPSNFASFRRVALQLRQLQAFAGVDDRLQQRRHRQLRMGQVHPVPIHVVRVSADVGNDENAALDSHELEF